MLRDPVGAWILENKPRITDDVLDGLESLEEGTLGYAKNQLERATSTS
jgi:hypothetical protein